MPTRENWFAIVNPSSANGKTKDKWPMFHDILQNSAIHVEFAYTSGYGKGTFLTREAIAKGYRKIIAVGGDGTVNEVVNGLIVNDCICDDNIELAVLSNGTGSDFIRTLKPENDIHTFVRALKRECYRSIDIGKIIYHQNQQNNTSRYFINVSNLGIGAEVVNLVNKRSKALGSKLTYFTGTMSTILKYKNMEVSMKLDNSQIIEGVFCGLMICNGQYIGGGMQIAPLAELDDGWFDIMVINDITKLKLFSRFPLIYKGKHIELPEVEVYRCQSLAIQTLESTIIEADGEIIGRSPCQYSILPKCLRLRV